MVTHCFTPVLGKRLRAVGLDGCGAALAGAPVLVSDGFVTVTLTAETEDGAEIIQRNASGAICVNEKMANSFKYLTVEIEFCGVNPSLLAMVTNAKTYADWAGDVAGFTLPEGEIDKRFSLELWTGLSGVACQPGQTGEASGYLLLPQVNAGAMGDITIDGENAVTFSVTDAYTVGGNLWGIGPFDVLSNGAAGVNEVQSVTITGTPTGGTFTLTFNGGTTAPIAYNAAAAAVQTALNALPSVIAAGGVTVTGGPGPGTPYVITFVQKANFSQITATGSFTGGTSPAISTNTTTPGNPSAAKLPTAIDPFDHLLLIDTSVAPPPVSCSPTPLSFS